MRYRLDTTEILLLDIIKSSLFDIPVDAGAYNAEEIDWGAVFRKAARHNVLPLVLQNINDLIAKLSIPEEKVKRWRIAAHNQIAFNEKLMFCQNSIVEILDKAGIPYAVLKGSGLSACYPRPDLRVLHNIDLLLRPSDFGQALNILYESGFGRRVIEKSFHEVLCREDVLVEPHASVPGVDGSRAGEKIKAFFEDALEHTEAETVGACSFKVLAPERQAVALLLCMERLIVENRLDLRRLCDWAMFVCRKTGKEMWASRIQPELVRFGLDRFAKLMTKICVLFLGLNPEHCPWAEEADENLCEKLLAIVLRNYSAGDRQPAAFVLSSLRAGSKFPLLNKVPAPISFAGIFARMRDLYEMKAVKKARGSVLETVREAARINRVYGKLKLYKAK